MVRSLRTDRGGEFYSHQFNEYFEKTMIYRQFKDPFMPQKNGIVERRNRTVVAMIRSFLKNMNLPQFLWREALRHSIYILNRLPTRALSGQPPYEAWTGVKPNLK